MADCREPSLVNGDLGSIYKRGTTTAFDSVEDIAKQYITDYNNMATSVEKYGGFYIGRYEITDNGEQPGKVISGSFNDWYYLYNKSMTLGKENSETSMIYGTLWDATMQWLAKSNYSVGYTGNNYSGYGIFSTEAVIVKDYTTTIIVKPNEIPKRLQTGQTSYTRSNNIYDLSGNNLEWTQEAGNTQYAQYRICRGGHSDNNCYSSYRFSMPSTISGDTSSRPQLYIKVD